MSLNLAFDFSVNRENNTINVKRVFAAALPLVWDAYTNSEILDQWWAPKPWKARTKKMDFREGGQWLYAMVGPQGEEHWAIATYTDLPKSRWEVHFSDLGHHTRVEMRISYDDLAQLEATIQMGFKEGLSMAMEGLDELLASIKQ